MRGLKCTCAKAEKHLREVEKSIRPTEMSASRNRQITPTGPKRPPHATRKSYTQHQSVQAAAQAFAARA